MPERAEVKVIVQRGAGGPRMQEIGGNHVTTLPIKDLRDHEWDSGSAELTPQTVVRVSIFITEEGPVIICQGTGEDSIFCPPALIGRLTEK